QPLARARFPNEDLIPGAPVGCRLAFAPGGRLLVVGTPRGPIRLWDVATGAWVGQLPGHSHSVTAFAFAPDGKTLASGSADTTILLWDLSPFFRKVAKPSQPSAGNR